MVLTLCEHLRQPPDGRAHGGPGGGSPATAWSAAAASPSDVHPAGTTEAAPSPRCGPGPATDGRGGGAAPARRDAVPTRTVRPTTFATWPPQTPRRPATADPAPRPNRSRAPRATSCRHEQCGRHYRRTARPATVDRGGTPRCPSGSAPTCATTQQMATPPPSRQLPDHQQGPRWRRRHAPTPAHPGRGCRAPPPPRRTAATSLPAATSSDLPRPAPRLAPSTPCRSEATGRAAVWSIRRWTRRRDAGRGCIREA
jgi:hypothetical protein